MISVRMELFSSSCVRYDNVDVLRALLILRHIIFLSMRLLWLSLEAGLGVGIADCLLNSLAPTFDTRRCCVILQDVATLSVLVVLLLKFLYYLPPWFCISYVILVGFMEQLMRFLK